MRLDVIYERALLAKVLGANVACKGLLPGVDLHMIR